MKAAIAGAGIGGLTTAIALARAGVSVRVFEQARRLEEVGAGLQLSPNAVRVLSKLGMGEALETIASWPVSLEMRMGISDRRIFSIPIADRARRKFGFGYAHVHRADLVSILSDAAIEAGARVELGARVIEALKDDGGVRVGLSTGEVESFDLLVGADGLHSVVREKAIAPDNGQFTGCVAWRMIVPAEQMQDLVEPARARVWVGPGKHAVIYPIRGGKQLNFVGVTESGDRAAESWREEGDVAEVARDFAGWAEPVQRVIEAGSTCHRWALFERTPMRRWSSGPITLLGDACHAMLPFQAQGAAMAIEDAWALADCVASSRWNVDEALGQYQRRRQARTEKVARSARSNRNVFHRRRRSSQFLTYGPMWLADRVAPSIVHGRQDWLYGHDETAVKV